MLHRWISAARPKTLTAAFVPVAVGSAVALHNEAFVALPAAVALLCALLLQIGANFANDLFDHLSGADTRDRMGPTRAVASGAISPHAMKRATIIVLGMAFLAGLYLVFRGGWPVLAIGIASIAGAVIYTGGPKPLGYAGFGDVMVFLFFGLIGTVGTYYVQALGVTPVVFVASIPVGAMITNILVVNNYRDIETDRSAGKRTSAVILGERFARGQYAAALVVSYAVPVLMWILFEMSAWVLLPLISLPIAINLARLLKRLRGINLNPVLEKTAALAALYGVLFAIGIFL